MVPIRPDRVRAAMEADGWTPGSLANELNKPRSKRPPENRQTIHHLMQGKASRCRSSRRKALAATLQVPEPWLAGQDWALPTNEFFDRPRHFQEVHIPINAFEMIRHVSAVSPRIALLVSRLADRCTRAVARDLARFQQVQLKPGFFGFSPEYEALSAAVLCILHLAFPERWRRHLMGPSYRPTGIAFPAGHVPKVDAGEERAAQALAAALDYMLEPWLEGRERLSYGRLADLVGVSGVDPRHFLSMSVRPEAIKELDGTSHDPSDPLVPFAVMGWQKPRSLEATQSEAAAPQPALTAHGDSGTGGATAPRRI
jgi:hypothetical protein